MNNIDPIPFANKQLKRSIHTYLNNNKFRQRNVNNSSVISLNELDKKLGSILKAIPDIEDIFSESLTNIKKEFPKILEPSYIQENFGRCLTTLEKTAFNFYLRYQKRSFESLIELWVSENKGVIEKLSQKCPTPEKFAEEICNLFYPLIQRMEFRAGQKRKARGGGTFQMAVEYLLRKIEIPCEKPTGKYAKILKRIDLVVPDQKTAIERPDQAFFVSAKRTLRERWKQTIPERKPSWRVFLITIDEELSVEKADEINSLGMILYIQDKLKSKPSLKRKSWIRNLSALPKDIKN